MRALLEGITTVPTGGADPVIRGLSMDSRTLAPGELFLACRGLAVHGAAYLGEALERGAAAGLVEAPVPAGTAMDWPGMPVIEVPRLGALAGALADRFYNAPSKELRVVGITGTNGKTTVAHLVAQGLTHLHGKPEACGLFGTLGYGVPGCMQPGARTTPDAITLHHLLGKARDNGALEAVMEVSSHALSQNRVGGVRFTLGVFTNLGRDHLDYHASIAEYADTKRRLFDASSLGKAVLNVDDRYGRRWMQELRDKLEVYAYCLEAMPPAGVPCLRAKVLSAGWAGLLLELAGPWGSRRLQSPLIGKLNAINLLAAATTLLALGYRLDETCEALAEASPVPGRMEVLASPGHPMVVVDYAHTPDALNAVLGDLRRLVAGGRLYCVFGCGGGRDRGKRPLMGEVATKLADCVILTDDNPREEPSAEIIAAVRTGCTGSAEVREEPDRGRALALALGAAGPDDVVLIAGKGHEAVQQIGANRVPFDDRETVRRLWT